MVITSSNQVKKTRRTMDNDKVIAYMVKHRSESTELRVKRGQPWMLAVTITTVPEVQILRKDIDTLRCLAKSYLEDEIKLYEDLYPLPEIPVGIPAEKCEDQLADCFEACQKSSVHTINYFIDLLKYIHEQDFENIQWLFDNIRMLFKWTYLPKEAIANKFYVHNFMKFLKTWRESEGDVEKNLLLWYVEDQIAESYSFFLTTIKKLFDCKSASKQVQAASILKECLMDHPLQERMDVSLIFCKALEKTTEEKPPYIHILKDILLVCRPIRMYFLNTLCQDVYGKNTVPSVRMRSAALIQDVFLMKDDSKLILLVLQMWLRAAVKIINGILRCPDFFRLVITGLKHAIRRIPTPCYEELNAVMEEFCAEVGERMACYEPAFILLNFVVPLSHEAKKYIRLLIFNLVADYEFPETDNSDLLLTSMKELLIEDRCWQRVRAITKRTLQRSMYVESQASLKLLKLVSSVFEEHKTLEGLADTLNASQSKPKKCSVDISPEDATVPDTEYDMEEVNPQYAGAEKNHYEPIVSDSADLLINKKPVKYYDTDWDTSKYLWDLACSKLKEEDYRRIEEEDDEIKELVESELNKKCKTLVERYNIQPSEIDFSESAAFSDDSPHLFEPIEKCSDIELESDTNQSEEEDMDVDDDDQDSSINVIQSGKSQDDESQQEEVSFEEKSLVQRKIMKTVQDILHFKK